MLYPIFVTTFRLKFHPDDATATLRQIKEFFESIGGINVRVFKTKSVEYQIVWGYSISGVDAYQVALEKGKELMITFGRNVVATHNDMYGDAGAEVVTAILQDCNCVSFFPEVTIPIATACDTSCGFSKSRNPIVLSKFRLLIHPEDVHGLLQKWKELSESFGILDLRFFQLTSQEYLQIYTYPVRTVHDYHRLTAAKKEFMKFCEEQLEVLDIQLLGNLPTEIRSLWVQAWRPSVVAGEITFLEE
jgi:hypothetical protein